MTNPGVGKVGTGSGEQWDVTVFTVALGTPLMHPLHCWPITLSLGWSPSPAPLLFPGCSTPSQASNLGLETSDCSQIDKQGLCTRLGAHRQCLDHPESRPAFVPIWPHVLGATNQQPRCTQVPAFWNRKGGEGSLKGT